MSGGRQNAVPGQTDWTHEWTCACGARLRVKVPHENPNPLAFACAVYYWYPWPGSPEFLMCSTKCVNEEKARLQS